MDPVNTTNQNNNPDDGVYEKESIGSRNAYTTAEDEEENEGKTVAAGNVDIFYYSITKGY